MSAQLNQNDSVLSEFRTVDPLRGLCSRGAKAGKRVPVVRQVQVCAAPGANGWDLAAAPATDKPTRILQPLSEPGNKNNMTNPP
jgi:hypothetical protein